ncbi:glycosyltransferase family 4 protein [Dongia sp.]|uniref:glycosyltransferase family 4 protein n=1 Tax=Dongia sp. TaxID=1977262 RepID=UPI0037515D0B
MPPTVLDLAAVVPGTRSTIAHLHEHAGRLRQAAHLLQGDRSPYAERMRGLAVALDRGGLTGLDAADAAPKRLFNGRAVMALHGAPPWLNNGYTVRTLCLLQELARQGMQCLAVTRPNFPRDQVAFRNVTDASFDAVEGQRYERLTAPVQLWEGPLDAYIRAYADRLATMARTHEATVIHAASNYVCGLAAVLAAERVGARSVYEIRGLWHWSTVNRRPGWERSESFALHEVLERQAALRADRVIVLAEALAEHARDWGVPAERIRRIGNGVALDRFSPQLRDDALRARWGAGPGSFVLGFVGTFAPYEGLDVLLQAAALLRQRGIDVRPVLIGGGETAAGLRASARRLDLPVHIGDRVPHAEVPRVLASMDCCPFPRQAAGATLLVPPLKLGEAMATGVPVVVADIAPLTEMVRDGVNGRIVAPGPSALADGLATVWRDRDGSRRMAAAARGWMAEHRSWPALTERLIQTWSD